MSITELLDHRRLRECTFVIVDFETVTPAGRPPEPIELAAARINPPLLIDQHFQKSWLIRPPEDVALTPFDIRQTGIKWVDLFDKPDAVTVLRECEILFHNPPAILVAHNASYEAHIIWRFTHACPALATFPFIDTIALAKQVLPPLNSYRLDALAQYFSFPIPQHRHRALPDVQLTVQIFLALVKRFCEIYPVATIADMKRVAGLVRKKQPITQMNLFE